MDCNGVSEQNEEQKRSEKWEKRGGKNCYNEKIASENQTNDKSTLNLCQTR